MRQGVSPEVEERLVAGHGIMGLAIQDRDGPGIAVFFRAQSPDELIQELQVGVIVRLPERVNDDWVNLTGGWASPFRRRCCLGPRRGGRSFPHKQLVRCAGCKCYTLAHIGARISRAEKPISGSASPDETMLPGGRRGRNSKWRFRDRRGACPTVLTDSSRQIGRAH